MINWLLKYMKPLIIWQGNRHMPWAHKKITGEHYYKWRDKIKPGTVFLTTTYGELSNIFNPAEMKHAAIYVGMIDGIAYVIESLGKGVTKKDLVTFLTTKDEVVALEPLFLTDNDRRNIYPAAKKLLGIGYDYMFEAGKKSLYCFETVLVAYQELYPALTFKVSEIAGGKKIYDHNTFLKDPNKFKVILDSRGKK